MWIFRAVFVAAIILPAEYASGSCNETIKEVAPGQVEYFKSCHANYKFFEYHAYEKLEASTTSRSIDIRIGTSRAICSKDAMEAIEDCFSQPMGRMESNSIYFRFHERSKEWIDRDYRWSFYMPGLTGEELMCAVGVTDEDIVHMLISRDGYTNFIDCAFIFDDYLSYENTNLKLALIKE